MIVRILVTLLTALVWVMIYRYKGTKQVFPILMLMFLIPPDVYLVGSHPPLRTATVVFLAVLAYKKTLLPLLKSFPLKNTCLFFCLSALIISQGELDNGVFKNLYIGVLVVLDVIAPMFIFYAAFSIINNQMLFYKRMLQFFVFIGLYGIYSQLSVTNPYMEIWEVTYNIRNIAADYLHNIYSQRTQTSSVFFHPYLLSILSCYTSLLCIYFIKSNDIKVNKILISFVLVMLLVNIYFTDSRTTILVLVLCIGVYGFLGLPTIKFLRYLMFVPFLILALSQVPQVQKISKKVYDVVQTGGKKTQGSSLAMREKQLDISLRYFSQSPIIGNGYSYINTKLGFTVSLKDRTSKKDAFGFESFFYVLIIEQGILGLVAYFVLFASLFVYHYRNYMQYKGRYRNFILLNMIFVVGYLMIILGTGTISSLSIFFALMGVSLSIQTKLRAMPYITFSI